MKSPSCYCDQAPRDRATGQARFRCNVCVNAVMTEKDRLVRQEQDFPARLAEAKAGGVREEGERILGRIREAIASWEREPPDEDAGVVIATLTVLASCITHRGVTREATLDAARKRLADMPTVPWDAPPAASSLEDIKAVTKAAAEIPARSLT